jgi:tetratricopeptide (TPR) repeat protein
MSIESNPRERLTKRLLAISDATEDRASEAAHPDEESLAQFCDGSLAEFQRDGIVNHLADCRQCRSVVASVLRETEEAKTQRATVALPQRAAWLNPRMLLAAAAAVLLMLTAWLLRGPRSTGEQVAYVTAQEALVDGEFDRVEAILDRAERGGAASARLRSLRAQAKRHIPNPLALAAAGRLSDFGHEIGGAVARDPATLPHRTGLAAAETLLADGTADDLETILNRGHLFLSQQRPQEALTEFERARRLAPQQPLAWLGSGIASFLLDDFTRAEADFRQAIRLDPGNLAARINLAMTLEEMGKTAETIDAWQEVLSRELDAGLRRQIELNVERLKEERANE